MAKDEKSTTDLRIGIADTGADLFYEIDHSVEKVMAKVQEALDNGKPLSLTDTKGRQIIVPHSKIAYVEAGNAADRKVGFTTL
jgi:Protein of unknown function (DUF3107)